jgi:hypothetical protein
VRADRASQVENEIVWRKSARGHVVAATRYRDADASVGRRAHSEADIGLAFACSEREPTKLVGSVENGVTKSIARVVPIRFIHVNRDAALLQTSEQGIRSRCHNNPFKQKVKWRAIRYLSHVAFLYS